MGAANTRRVGPEGWVLGSQVPLGLWPPQLQESSAGTLWKCKNTAAFIPTLFHSAVMLSETERHSQCLGAGLPLHKRTVRLLQNPHFQIYLREPHPTCLGCRPSAGPWGPYAQRPPHFTELIYRKGWLGSKAAPEHRRRAGPLL